MKLSRRLTSVFAFLAPLLAFAHPGHDGDHGFEWDFDHLVEHPSATIVCFGLLAAAAWLGWRKLKTGKNTKSVSVEHDSR